MPSVTVKGANSQSVGLTFDSQSNFLLAQQIASQISAGLKSGSMTFEPDAGNYPPAPPTGESGVYIQSQTDTVFLPSTYSVDLVTKFGNAAVYGGTAANEIILASRETNLAFNAVGGSGTVVAGGGTDRLVVTGGNWLLHTDSGNDVIIAGRGMDTISAGTGANSIQLLSGSNLVISQGQDTIQIASGSATIDATSAVSDYVDGGSSNLLFYGGSGGVTILGGAGSDTYYGNPLSSGKQLIEGGWAGNNYLFAGNGAATLVGGGANDQLLAYGNSDQVLIAGAGNETLSALFSSGHDSLVGGSGKDIMYGGSGADTFLAGTGNATIRAGAGDVFDFINAQAGGKEVIQGYNNTTASSIQIHLEGYGADAISSQKVSGGSLTVSLSDGTKLTFQNVTTLLKDSNFT